MVMMVLTVINMMTNWRYNVLVMVKMKKHDDQVNGEKDDDTDDHGDQEVQMRGVLQREHQQASVDGDGGDKHDEGDDEKDVDTDFHGEEWVFATGASGGVC